MARDTSVGASHSNEVVITEMKAGPGTVLAYTIKCSHGVPVINGLVPTEGKVTHTVACDKCKEDGTEQTVTIRPAEWR